MQPTFTCLIFDALDMNDLNGILASFTLARREFNGILSAFTLQGGMSPLGLVLVVC